MCLIARGAEKFTAAFRAGDRDSCCSFTAFGDCLDSQPKVLKLVFMLPFKDAVAKEPQRTKRLQSSWWRIALLLSF